MLRIGRVNNTLLKVQYPRSSVDYTNNSKKKKKKNSLMKIDDIKVVQLIVVTFKEVCLKGHKNWHQIRLG